jgi:hypothetical protein
MQTVCHAITLHPVQLYYMTRNAKSELSAGRLWHISTPPVAAAHALSRPGTGTQAIYYSPGLAASLSAC